MRTSLVVDALAMWTRTRSSTATEVPGQYTSAEFHRFCKENLIKTSVDRTGVCWDNAAAESFFAALKNEMYHRQH
jgi:transposase InsO family protein